MISARSALKVTPPSIRAATCPVLSITSVVGMAAGGTVVTFEVGGGKYGAFSVMNAFRLIAVSNNLGDSKSLATHPATTTHMRIGAEERAKLGITDGVIRVSIGLEDPEDLKEDLTQALATMMRAPPARAAE